MINREVIIVRENWECRECMELAEECGEVPKCDACKPRTGELISIVNGLFKTYGIIRIGRRLHKIPIEKIRLPKGD